MAILSGIPGLVVTIDVDGQDLPEYDDEEANDTPITCTKYIEARSGARFGIARRYDALVFPHKNYGIHFKIYADGKLLTHVRDDQKRISRAGGRYVRGHASTMADGRKFHQHLLFGELQMSEGKADQKLFGKLDDLGTIIVKCYRVEIGDFEDHDDDTPSGGGHRRGLKDAAKEAAARQKFRSLLKDDAIPEKNLKGRAISHQAKLGDPVEQPAYETGLARANTFVDKHSFASFKFIYRSRSALQGLCIITRTPEPVPLEDRPIEDLTPEEMRELLRRQKANVKQEVKRERGQSDAAAGETRVGKARRTGANQAVEVIDLSGD